MAGRIVQSDFKRVLTELIESTIDNGSIPGKRESADAGFPRFAGKSDFADENHSHIKLVSFYKRFT